MATKSLAKEWDESKHPRAAGERSAVADEKSGAEGKGAKIEDYMGDVGNQTHITRTVSDGTIPTEVVANMLGKNGEIPGAHRNLKGAEWEAFKQDIKENGIKHPIFITVDHDKPMRLDEGNHRRDAAVALGIKDIPVEIRYFGHAEQQGTVLERAQRQGLAKEWDEAKHPRAADGKFGEGVSDGKPQKMPKEKDIRDWQKNNSPDNLTTAKTSVDKNGNSFEVVGHPNLMGKDGPQANERILVVAKDPNGKVIGYTQAEYSFGNKNIDGPVLSVSKYAVDEGLRGQKIATNMISALHENVRSMGDAPIILHGGFVSNAGQAFAESMNPKFNRIMTADDKEYRKPNALLAKEWDESKHQRGAGGRFGSGDGNGHLNFKTWDDVEKWGEKNGIYVFPFSLRVNAHMTPESMSRVCQRIEEMDKKFPGLKKELGSIGGYEGGNPNTLAVVSKMDAEGAVSSMEISKKIGDAYANPDEFKKTMLETVKPSNEGTPRWSACFGDHPDDTINHELGHVIQNMMKGQGLVSEPKSSWNTKTNPYVKAASEAGLLTRTSRTGQGPNLTFGSGYVISAYASTSPLELHAEALSLMQRPDILATLTQKQQDTFGTYVESINKLTGQTMVKEQAESATPSIIEDDFGLDDEFWQKFYERVDQKSSVAKYNPDQPRDSHGRFGEGEGSGVKEWQSTKGKEAKTAAQDFMKQAINQPTFTEKQSTGILHYVNSSRAMNQYLRNGIEIPNEGIGSKQDIEAIKSAMQDTTTKEPMALFRGVDASVLEGVKEGDIINDKGFCSTSLLQAGARPSDRTALMEISAPEGTHCVVPLLDKTVRPAAYAEEAEVILPPDTSFRVDSIKADGTYALSIVPSNAEKSFASKAPQSEKDQSESHSRFIWKKGDVTVHSFNQRPL
jgi:GNAT superfamily N-acetyltransferase